MFCYKCGKEITSDAKFCTYCGSQTLRQGTYIATVQQQNSYWAGVTMQPVVSQMKQKDAGKRRAAIVFAVLALLVFIFSFINTIQNAFFVPNRATFPIGLVSRLPVIASNIVLLLYMIFRKKEGYNKSLKIILSVSMILYVSSAFLQIFFEARYIYINSTIMVKALDFIVGVLLSSVLWLFLGCFLGRSWEKFAAIAGGISLIISIFENIVVYYGGNVFVSTLLNLLLVTILELPYIILLFVYPVLSKSMRKGKEKIRRK